MNKDIRNIYNQETSKNFYDNDYVKITDRLDYIFHESKSEKIEEFTFVYCEKGKLKIELNNTVFCLHKNDILVCLPNSLINLIEEKSDNKLIIICFSNRLAHRMTQTEKGTWKMMEHLHVCPVRHMTKNECVVLKKYIDLISDKIDADADKFQKDILMHIASAMFTEMIAIAYQNSNEDCTDDSSEECLRQSDYIFNNFMEAVTADKGRHRTIGYYAEMLCYTPKYLSTIVKKVCGKNALTLINDNAIEHIIAELKYSDKNIKQIAFDFNFSNNSFFSKFFKMHTGISPTEYRNNIIKNEDGKTETEKNENR